MADEEPSATRETVAVTQELAEERGLARRLSRELGFADFMAVLMVAATGLSAFATWRTATIAQSIYLASERPYVGVEAVWIDRSRSDDPRVEVDFRNFGNVAAQDVKVSRLMKIDGVVVKNSAKAIDAGILSPSTPHRLHVHIPRASYPAISTGGSTLLIEVAASFASAQRQMCYLERFRYVADENEFLVAGGSTDCAAEAAVEQAIAAGLPSGAS